MSEEIVALRRDVELLTAKVEALSDLMAARAAAVPMLTPERDRDDPYFAGARRWEQSALNFAAGVLTVTAEEQGASAAQVEACEALARAIFTRLEHYY